jgi:hypothetical protein
MDSDVDADVLLANVFTLTKKYSEVGRGLDFKRSHHRDQAHHLRGYNTCMIEPFVEKISQRDDMILLERSIRKLH